MVSIRKSTGPARLSVAVLWAALLSTADVRGDQELSLLVDDLPDGTTGIGGALRWTGTPYAGGTEELDFVPLYLYEGRRAFIHGTALGVHLLQDRDLEIDIVGRYRFWQLDPGGEALGGIEERSQTLDAGLALRWQRRGHELSLEWLADLLDKHGGHQLDATYRRTYRRGRWQVSPFIGVSVLDSELTQYYFGVDESERSSARPAYSPGRAANLRYGVNASYDLGDGFRLYANVGVSELDRSLFESPLVEKTLWPTLLFGSSYFFGSVYEPRARVPPRRRAEWSWRVNYGYQAEGNIVGDIDRGDFRRSVTASTRIGGVTVGKLLDEGHRFDIVGRLALFRHFERGLQEDFFSTAAYVMAIGKGYLPWSDRLAFRWGFGIGLSYAERVPIVEQIERAEGSRARFQNYLEMMIDFPLPGRRRGSMLGDCFVGLTTVHRSGIFATSNLLGDVAGGSDWLTAHLECVR